MNETNSNFRLIRWCHDYKVELGLCLAINLLAAIYFLFPSLRDSLKNVYFVPVVVSALMLGWKKSSAFTVLGVSLVFCITCHDWQEDSAKEFFQLIIWGCTLGTTSALIGLIVLTKDRQVLRLLKRQNSLALTDQLTQVANRRAFDSELRRRISEFARYRCELSVLMVDIDFFKKFNDRYGHGVGDAVLQTIARKIQISLRDADLVARFGGEEFAVLLPNTGIDEAMIVAERIRSSVDQVSEADVNCPEKVSVSIGITDVENSDTQATILERADIAMYEAKRNGRNRVCIKRLYEVDSPPSENFLQKNDELIEAVFEEGQFLQQVVDSVTGLTYLKVFDSELTRRIDESTRYGVNLCLGLLQLKQDQEIEANKADIRVQIANIGRTIDKSLRTSDLVTWYSELEFGILLPFTNVEDGQKVLQRLFVEIGSDTYQTGINSLFQVAAIRVIELDACETKSQAIGKLRATDPLEFNTITSYW